TGGTDTIARRDHGAVDVILPSDIARRVEILEDFEKAAMGWLWATDSEARLTYISQSAADKLGCPIDDLLARPLIALFETDPDNPDERSDRPLNFQIKARNKLTDLVVRFLSPA